MYKNNCKQINANGFCWPTVNRYQIPKIQIQTPMYLQVTFKALWILTAVFAMNRPITMSSPETGLLAKQTLKSSFSFHIFCDYESRAVHRLWFSCWKCCPKIQERKNSNVLFTWAIPRRTASTTSRVWESPLGADEIIRRPKSHSPQMSPRTFIFEIRADFSEIGI